MRLAAMDPGTRESALVVWDGVRVEYAVVWPNEKLLAWLRAERACPSLLCIEQVESYGMAVGREVFETVYWSGRFREAHEARGGEVRMVPRREAKMHLCNDSRAKDANIRQALLDKFGGKEATRKGGPLHGITSHKWAALAVAVTVSETMASPNYAAGAGA